MTRDGKGRFLKGTAPGPGRNKKEVEDTYLQAFRDSVLPRDWAAIISKAVSDAKRGDAVARKFIADYLIGTALQKMAPTTPDGEREYGSNAMDGLVRRLLQDATEGDETETPEEPE